MDERKYYLRVWPGPMRETAEGAITIAESDDPESLVAFEDWFRTGLNNAFPFNPETFTIGIQREDEAEPKVIHPLGKGRYEIEW